MYHQEEQVVWNTRPMVLAELTPSEFTTDFWATGSDYVVKGKALQLDGSPYTPDVAEEFIATDTVNGGTVKGTIGVDGNWSINLRSNVEGLTTWRLSPVNDPDVGMGNVNITYHNGVEMFPAPYSSSELHFGKEGTLAYAFKDANGDPIKDAVFCVAINSDEPNAKISTDDWGVATFTIPYVVDQDRVTADAEFAGKQNQHVIVWSSDSILLPVDFEDLIRPDGIALGDLFTINGKAIDQRGNPIDHGPVGLYDRRTFNYGQRAVDPSSKRFELEMGPWDQAGVKEMILYTGSHYEVVTVEVIDGLISFNRVNVDESSNKYILIENGEVLPKPIDIKITLDGDNPSVGIVNEQILVKGDVS